MTNPTTEPPRHLGRYELVHLLGQGGMGEVYLAKISGAAGFEKPCIVKTILPALLKDSQFLDRFHHEAKVLVHLVHSSIAQVYDMGEADGTYYMALEYVAGVDVAYLAEQARNQGQPIPVPVALYIGQKVAEGLGYAHRKTGPDGTPLGIVHRDVSPHNVMVSYEGEVKVIDFGLAKSAARSKYTLPSTVMGKLGYMSPEQARAEPLDHRTDIYSCGVMIWELLAGRPLIGHGTVGEMMAAMARPQVPSLHELRPQVDPAIDAVVRRALAPDPQERYGRADELARALNENLLRFSTALGAEEVGNFVRALCPEAFSAQRKLISRISGVRRPPSTPPMAGVLPASGVAAETAGAQPITGMEATSVRPLSAMEADSHVPYRPMATPLPGAPQTGAMPAGAMVPQSPRSGPMVAAAPPSSPHPVAMQSGPHAPASGLTKTKLLVGGVIVFLLITTVAAVTALVVRSSPQPVAAFQNGRPPPDRDGHPPPGPHDGPPDAERPPHAGWPRPSHPPREGPPGRGPRGEPPPSSEPEMNAGPTPEAGTVAAEGSPGAAPTVPVVGKAGSPEVAPAVVTAPPAIEASPEPSNTSPKAPPPRTKPKPTGEFIKVKNPLQILQRNGIYGVAAGKKAGLTQGMELKVVSAAGSNGLRKVLGRAKVQEVVLKRRLAVLLLDESALKAGGDRFVAMPTEISDEASDSEAEAEVAPPAPPAAPAPEAPAKRLSVGVRQTGLLGINEIDRTFIVHNSESKALSRCKATIHRRGQYMFSYLRRGENKVKQGQFKPDAQAPVVPEGRMLIECEEGRVEAEIQR